MLLVEFEFVIRSKEGYGEDDGFRIYNVRVVEPDERCNKNDTITILGYNIPKAKGLRYLIDGVWKRSERFGEQFQVKSFEEIIPPTYKGIIGFLSSGRIQGITPAIAELIYTVFRNNTIQMLDEDAQRLNEVPGIGADKCNLIIESYEKERVFKKLYLRLKKYGISEKTLRQAYRGYGKEVNTVIAENPYVLSDYGIAMNVLDRMAKDFKVISTTGKAKAVILSTIKNIEDSNGNMCATNEVFVEAVMRNALKYHISKESLSAAEDILIKENRLIYFNEYVYRKKMYQMENDVAKEVYRIIKEFRPVINFDIDVEIRNSERILKCKLHSQQREAVKAAISHGLLIITGGPGTGKTMVIKVIRNIFERVLKKEMLFLAPTGRAAARMKESSGFGAYTIHGNLHITDEGLEEKRGTTIKEDCTICDETSMLDIFVSKKLFESIQNGKQLILVGDVEQLPSVGPGAVLKDLINSGFVATIYLTKVFRQASNSNIFLNCRKIVKGNLSLEYGDDFVLLDAYTQEDAADLMADAFMQEVNKHGLEEVCCLCPFRKATQTGVNMMNQRIQKMINPYSSTKPELLCSSTKTIYRLGDRIMNLKNGNECSNGDLGYIVEVGSNYIVGKFNEVTITYEYDDFNKVTLAYAMTIHKSQGSEFKSVISTMLEQHGGMLQMNLFNTAVSRATERFTLVGNEEAINMAILNRNGIQRVTNLCEKVVILFTHPRGVA